jgi:glycosyltransferase involved in cell wall biosynthesis
MISIIIPTLNEEKYIGRILDCLKNQSFKQFEVIVVDGHSDDRTREIAKRYKFVKVVKSKIRNVSYQRDLGVVNANYRRLLFLDADGYIKPKFLEKALNEIKKKKLIVTGCYLYPNSKNLFYRMVYFFFRGWIRFISNLRPVEINGASLFSTKEMHEKIGGFNQKITFAEDYDYSYKAQQYCKTRLLNSVRLFTSVRRFETEGRFWVALKYLFIGLYITLFGNPRPGTFRYRFGHYK